MAKSVFLWIPLILWTTIQEPIDSVEVSFYSEKISISFAPQILPRYKPRINANSITQFYGHLEKQNYQILLNDLSLQKERLKLNDWLYYQLVEKSVKKIYQTQPQHVQSLMCWFLLTKSGYDTRVTFRDSEVYLCAYTQEKVFEVPMIKQDGRTFVNITEIGKKAINQSPVYLLDYVANPKGAPFSFSLQEMPSFKEEIEQKFIKFRYLDSLYNWPVQINRTYIKLMENYPFIDETEYIQAPMSTLMTKSLLPQIRQSVKGMSSEEAVKFITVFTRSAFRYMEDKSYFGKSKPMIPDEVLHYPFSDCEDRSALFYALVREVLSIPMVLLAYPDHLTVAVHLPGSNGEAITYKDKRYLVCDPTGPYNSSEIGRIPKELKGVPYEIIHHYQKN